MEPAEEPDTIRSSHLVRDAGESEGGAHDAVVRGEELEFDDLGDPLVSHGETVRQVQKRNRREKTYITDPRDRNIRLELMLGLPHGHDVRDRRPCCCR